MMVIFADTQAWAEDEFVTASGRLGLGVGVHEGTGASFETDLSYGPLIAGETSRGTSFFIIPELGYTLSVDEHQTHHFGTAGIRVVGGNIDGFGGGGLVTFLVGGRPERWGYGFRVGIIGGALLGAASLEISYQWMMLSPDTPIHGGRFMASLDILALVYIFVGVHRENRNVGRRCSRTCGDDEYCIATIQSGEYIGIRCSAIPDECRSAQERCGCVQQADELEHYTCHGSDEMLILHSH